MTIGARGSLTSGKTKVQRFWQLQMLSNLCDVVLTVNVVLDGVQRLVRSPDAVLSVPGLLLNGVVVLVCSPDLADLTNPHWPSGTDEFGKMSTNKMLKMKQKI